MDETMSPGAPGRISKTLLWLALSVVRSHRLGIIARNVYSPRFTMALSLSKTDIGKFPKPLLFVRREMVLPPPATSNITPAIG